MAANSRLYTEDQSKIMLDPPIAFTSHCGHTDKYHRTLHFTGPPIRVLVSAGSNSPIVPYFVHASAVWRFSTLFRANFEQHQIWTQAQTQALAQGAQVTPSPSETSWQECTVHIPNCDPEVFELYLNWQYTERFPIPINLREDDGEDESKSPGGKINSTDSNVAEDKHDEEGDYFRHAVLFLTKAYVLGRKVHGEYFQFELTKVIREIHGRMILGYGGYETTIEAMAEASRIIAEG